MGSYLVGPLSISRLECVRVLWLEISSCWASRSGPSSTREPPSPSGNIIQPFNNTFASQPERSEAQSGVNLEGWRHAGLLGEVLSSTSSSVLCCGGGRPSGPSPSTSESLCNPCRNVALASGRAPAAWPAGAAASRRSAACTSASPAWTVVCSAAPRRTTAPAAATPCVETACPGPWPRPPHTAPAAGAVRNERVCVCVFQILQEDQAERFPGRGVCPVRRPSASLRASL